MDNSQIEFFKLKSKTLFGGSLLRDCRKAKRPISTKHAMHLVMRVAPTIKISLLKPENFRSIEGLVNKLSKKFGVLVYEKAINSNHIHFLVRFSKRTLWKNWIRSLTGLIARKIMGSEKGNKKGQSFWQYRPFSRIVEWGRDFRQAKNYVVQNVLEALGLIPYRPRTKQIIRE